MTLRVIALWLSGTLRSHCKHNVTFFIVKKFHIIFLCKISWYNLYVSFSVCVKLDYLIL